MGASDPGKRTASETDDPSKLAPLYLDATSVGRHALSAPITGEDPFGPGPLVLWRRAAGRFVPLARGHSNADGTFSFGQILVPTRGIEVVVARPGEDPRGASRSSTLQLAASQVSAPRARALREPETGTWALEVHELNQAGTLLIADAAGEPLSTLPLGGLYNPLQLGVSLDLSPSAASEVAGFVQIAFELPGGQRSRWSVVPIE